LSKIRGEPALDKGGIRLDRAARRGGKGGLDQRSSKEGSFRASLKTTALQPIGKRVSESLGGKTPETGRERPESQKRARRAK